MINLDRQMLDKKEIPTSFNIILFFWKFVYPIQIFNKFLPVFKNIFDSILPQAKLFRNMFLQSMNIYYLYYVLKHSKQNNI